MSWHSAIACGQSKAPTKTPTKWAVAFAGLALGNLKARKEQPKAQTKKPTKWEKWRGITAEKEKAAHNYGRLFKFASDKEIIFYRLDYQHF